MNQTEKLQDPIKLKKIMKATNEDQRKVIEKANEDECICCTPNWSECKCKNY